MNFADTPAHHALETAEPYYAKYEQRYQAVHAAGASWGFAPEDQLLQTVLTQWVRENRLEGKRIIEFACGEGAAGKILSDLGCIYHGVDLAPSAVEAARRVLSGSKNATVSRLDMVRDRVPGTYDAALDIMGFHILITDRDRQAYLQNVCGCLIPGAPVLFYRQAYRADAYEGPVDSYAQWTELMGIDYDRAEKRQAKKGGASVEVMLPRIAGRSRTEAGYRKELAENGFTVDCFQPEFEGSNPYRASIWFRKSL